MILKQGNLFDSFDDIILVTANSYINKSGALVMGRGAALQLKIIHPAIDVVFGSMIEHLSLYGIRLVMAGDKMYGVFQVKYDFKSPAELDLIAYSVSKLKSYLTSSKTVSMNFPGIGYGRLFASNVFPIISSLPNNVSVYVSRWSDLYE